MQTYYPEIVKIKDVLNQTSWSKSTLYVRISQGLFPTPIPLGARAVGYLQSEVTTIVKAMVASSSHEQIKMLVQQLTAQRREIQ